MSTFIKDYKNSASTYDAMRYGERKRRYINSIHLDTLKSLLPSDTHIKVLDVGCGTGRGTIVLGQMGFNVIGIDFTTEMLEIAYKKKLEFKLNNITFHRGNAKKLPYKNNSIDFVVSLNFLHLFDIKTQRIFLKEMTRVLKPKGVIICEFNNYYRGIIAGKRTLKYNHTLTLNKIRDIHFLYLKDKLIVRKIYGSSLPYLWRIFQFFPTIGKRIEKLAHFKPFSYISDRFFVKAKK